MHVYNYVVEDFNHGAITLPSFNGGAGATVFTVDISSLIDDDVNERNEGFWLLIEVQNEDHVTIERSGLALVIIKDNDREFDCVKVFRRFMSRCFACACSH